METIKIKYIRKKCPHGKRKEICKYCGGSAICIHNRLRYQCKQCQGINICAHNNRRSQCKLCHGTDICVHDRRKYSCRDCNGKGICVHNRIKSQCIDCKGTRICIHNRQIYTCKDCKGKGICIHNRIKSQCIDCKGTQICIHDKRRSDCVKCEGTKICIHKLQKQNCKECNGVDCIICGEVKVRKYGNHDQTCYNCRSEHSSFGNIIKLRWEILAKEILDKAELHYTLYNKNLPCKQANQKVTRRPDFVFTIKHKGKTIIIILEIDEDYHRYYNLECEVKRIEETKEQIGGFPVVFIRFHPTDDNLHRLVRVLNKELKKKDFSTVLENTGTELVYFGYPDFRVQDVQEEAIRLYGALPWSVRIV